MVTLEELREPADPALVEACRRGDEAAFSRLVARYKDRVYAVVYRFVGNHEDALDISQEVFLRAYRGLDGFEGHAHLSTWLYSIAANLARNHLRDRGRKGRGQGQSLEALTAAAPGVAMSALQDGRTPRQHAEAEEVRARLEACLEALPENYRLAFVLRTFDDLNYDDIAKASGCPKGTVKSRLNQARARLRDCLRHYGLL